MPTEQTERLADVVASALECAVNERAQFLSDVCGDDRVLLREAEALLRFENNARDFIETSACQVVQEDLPNEVSEPIAARDPILEIETIEPITAPESFPENEAVIESEPERRGPAMESRDGEKSVVKPNPISASAKASSDFFEIPDFDAKERTPSRSAVWTRRGTLIALGLFAIAALFAVNAALRSAKEARHDRDIAHAGQTRAERINASLLQILSFSSPNFVPVWPVPQNRNTTVTEMLDQSAPRAQNELADPPDVRGEVLRRIGDIYASQGAHDAAEKNLRAALKTQTAVHGEQNAETVDTMVDLGVLLYRREKFAEAEILLEKAVGFLRKQNETLGGRSNAIKLAYALDKLGAVKFYRGDVKPARAVLEEALHIATEAQPKEPDRGVLTNIKTDLGGLLVLIGELRKGETLLHESLAESGMETSPPKWETAMTLQMLGELALARNRAPEAEDDFLTAEKIFRETLGEKNLYFARNLERRATVALIENDLSSAEELARKSFDIIKECSPNNKLPLTDPMMALSSILIKGGRVAEGEDYLRKAIRICEEQPTRNYAAIGLARIRLSQLLLSQNRFTEAENVAFEAYNQVRQHLEPDDPLRKATANNLIQIYEVQGKHKAADAVK